MKLKETEEKLGNPNLLTESIREMNLKQQRAIETIQSKLNEDNKIISQQYY